METLTEREQQKRYGTIEDFNANNFNKRYVFVLNHKNTNPSIEGRFFPNSFSLKLEDSILCPIKKTNRVIRVVDGEISIYKDEQTEDGQKREPKRVVFSPLGDFIVEGQEKLTLEWFLKTDKNGNNKDRNTSKNILFYLLNLKQGLDEQMGKDKSEAEALNWCYTADFKHIKRYARVLGMDIDKDPEEIRWGIRNVAKKDPVKFNDGRKNKHTIRKFYVHEGIDKGILQVDSRTNAISWAKTGNVIITAPIGVNPIDHFVDISFSNRDMELTFEVLKEQIEPTEQNKESLPEVIPVVKDMQLLTTQELINIALKKGIIVQKTAWFYFLDKSYQGKKLVEAIESDANLKLSLEKAISEKA